MISIVVPTLDRPSEVRRCVESVLAGSTTPDEVLVVDQSADGATEDAIAAIASNLVRYERYGPPSSSGARNHGVSLASGDYVALIDDDVEVPPEWLASVASELARLGYPDALYGDVRADRTEHLDGLSVTTHRVPAAREWHYPVHPSELGFGCHMVLRRGVLATVGGFDERLGPGTAMMAAEDIDFSYRLLKAGFRAASSPGLWVIHRQWRSRNELPRHFYGYNFAHSAFCAKHLRQHDAYAGRLFLGQVRDDARMFASAVRRHSWLRARVAVQRSLGTWRGLLGGWREFGARS